MRETKVANRYAKSLFGLASEKNQLEAVNSDMALVAATCQDNKELNNFLKSPIVKPDVKEKALASIFAGQIGEVSLSFIKILTAKKREYLLNAIAAEFANLYREAKGIVKVDIQSASTLSNEQIEQIKKQIGVNATQIEVALTINPDLIGGFVVRVGDKQFDGSVKRSLAELKKDFSINTYINKL